MTGKFFSNSKRSVHLGGYPLEMLKRGDEMPDLTTMPMWKDITYQSDKPQNIINAMGEFQAMMDAIRDGFVAQTPSTIPADLQQRAQHLKAFGCFNDAAMVGIGPVPDAALFARPRLNPDIARLQHALQTRQTKTLASGIDQIMADLRDSMQRPSGAMKGHHTALVFLIDHKRVPKVGEAGFDWIDGAQDHRAAILSSEIATVIANYIRLLGFDARAHSATTSDVDLGKLAVAAGLAWGDAQGFDAPWLGPDFGLAVVTTTMKMAHDSPLAPRDQQPKGVLGGVPWRLGLHGGVGAKTRDPYVNRSYANGAHPFETLRRVDTPTTYIDEANVARVPKRADLFARAQFGDLGPAVQAGARGGHYARKSAPSMAQRRVLGAFVLLQDGDTAKVQTPIDPKTAQESIKAASYFLGIDAVGASRCPDWTWYSHDPTGTPITPPHDQAVSMIVDQGFETMEGASGDDWISVAQSMRAYLRFSLLGGIIAQHIRNMGYGAKAHTVMDGDVLQPPLLLLAGLGEVSRIGEVILNPFLGPRLKSGVVTTTLPMAHDRPIDFGLQKFCDSCNKCARECPSGAITAGPKLMFNGYEIWKSDSQKCATYRITTKGGAMCGRCMKTCPWNLEGLFAEAPFRWIAMNAPFAAPALAKLDDMLGKGGLNPVKKWWWDVELDDRGAYSPSPHPVNARGLQTEIKLKYEDQTLAVYPAQLAPPPHPYPAPIDREAGIAAYRAMISADEYKQKSKAGEAAHIHRYTNDQDAPVVQVQIAEINSLSDDTIHYIFKAPDGGALPEWTAGAHLDVVVAPDFLRQYSMLGNPADRSQYEIAVLREDAGRGGSKLLHRIFTKGRRVFVSKPINHFLLDEGASKTHLFGGGIGVTPLIAFAHRLHALGSDFVLHYSEQSDERAAFANYLRGVPWAKNVHIYISANGTRMDLAQALPKFTQGHHIYTCGSDGYMQAITTHAAKMGYDDANIHLEYFSVPEQPDYENYDFTLELRDGRSISVAADQTASDALIDAGIPVDLKCSDGLCGVCQCGYLGGDVEHRDFVLSKAQRENTIILCQSRAAQKGGTVKLDI